VRLKRRATEESDLSPFGAIRSASQALHDHIEIQRSCLIDAEAVLDCMLQAIDEDARLDAPGPSYQSVVRIVREIVRSTIDQLDSINVNAVMPDVSAELSLGVKEEPAAYVH
jgi:hypothetical protein